MSMGERAKALKSDLREIISMACVPTQLEVL